MALDTEMSGWRVSAHLQMAELQADASLAEASVGLNLERIDNAIENAEGQAAGNLEIQRANMKVKSAKRNGTSNKSAWSVALLMLIPKQV